MKSSILRGLTLSALCCAFAVPGFPQRAPASTTPSASATTAAATAAAAQQEPVQLSAFEVVGEESRGYVTTSALSASRIAVPITELPASLIVINEKLIDDTLAVTIGDTFSLVSGVNKGNQGTASQESNTLVMRGYQVSGSQRDGIADRMITATGGFDYSYIERIEIVKGPSGVLYGSHTPGGVINFISKRPLTRPRTQISVMAGSWNFWRGEVDTSGFFDAENKLGYRLSGAIANTDGVNDFAGDPNDRFETLNPSLSYRFDNGLKVWAWAAFVRDGMNRTAYTAHAFRTGPDSGRVLFREAELAGNNIFLNLSKVESDNYELGLSHTLQLGPVTADVRLLGRKYELFSDASRIRGIGPGTDLFLDAEGRIIGQDSRFTDYHLVARELVRTARRQVRYDFRPSRTEGDEYAVDVNFGFDIGPTRHKLLAYGTFGTSDDSSQNDAYDITDAATLLDLGFERNPDGVVLTTTRPDPAFRPSPQTVVDRANVRTIRNTVVRDDEIYSFGAIERLSFWEDRAFLVGGGRFNSIETTTGQIVANQRAGEQRSLDETWTYSYAALAKVYNGARGVVSLFYNYNETFSPVFAIDRRLATFGQRFPNRVAETDEYGIKVDMLNNRVAITASIFDNTENNGLQSFNDEDGSVTGIPINTYQAPTGVRTTEGWEIDLNINALPGVEMLFSYGDIDARLENGGRVEAVPEKTFAALGRYDFLNGPLKGASATWIYNYWGKSVLGSRTDWELPSGDLHSLVLGYAYENWRFRFRVENIFDEASVLPGTFETAVGVTKPRNYRAGITYSF